MTLPMCLQHPKHQLHSYKNRTQAQARKLAANLENEKRKARKTHGPPALIKNTRTYAATLHFGLTYIEVKYALPLWSQNNEGGRDIDSGSEKLRQKCWRFAFGWFWPHAVFMGGGWEYKKSSADSIEYIISIHTYAWTSPGTCTNTYY